MPSGCWSRAWPSVVPLKLNTFRYIVAGLGYTYALGHLAEGHALLERRSIGESIRTGAMTI